MVFFVKVPKSGDDYRHIGVHSTPSHDNQLMVWKTLPNHLDIWFAVENQSKC
jgi:hypothetical protein